MAHLYKRDRIYWIKYFDPENVPHRKSLATTDEAVAKNIIASVEARIARGESVTPDSIDTPKRPRRTVEKKGSDAKIRSFSNGFEHGRMIGAAKEASRTRDLEAALQWCHWNSVSLCFGMKGCEIGMRFRSHDYKTESYDLCSAVHRLKFDMRKEIGPDIFDQHFGDLLR